MHDSSPCRGSSQCSQGERCLHQAWQVILADQRVVPLAQGSLGPELLILSLSRVLKDEQGFFRRNSWEG